MFAAASPLEGMPARGAAYLDSSEELDERCAPRTLILTLTQSAWIGQQRRAARTAHANHAPRSHVSSPWLRNPSVDTNLVRGSCISNVSLLRQVFITHLYYISCVTRSHSVTRSELM